MPLSTKQFLSKHWQVLLEPDLTCLHVCFVISRVQKYTLKMVYASNIAPRRFNKKKFVSILGEEHKYL